MVLLSVNNLEVAFPLRTGTVTAVRDVSFELNQGERLGIVGESGAGKSVSAFAILNLISKPVTCLLGRFSLMVSVFPT